MKVRRISCQEILLSDRSNRRAAIFPLLILAKGRPGDYILLINYTVLAQLLVLLANGWIIIDLLLARILGACAAESVILAISALRLGSRFSYLVPSWFIGK